MVMEKDGVLKYSIFGKGSEKIITIHNFLDNQQEFEPILPYLDGEVFTYAFGDFRGYG